IIHNIRLKGLPDAQYETQKEPGKHQCASKNFALESLDNQRDRSRQHPLIYQVWLERENGEQGRQQYQYRCHADSELSNTREVLANALIQFCGQSQTENG